MGLVSYILSESKKRKEHYERYKSSICEEARHRRLARRSGRILWAVRLLERFFFLLLGYLCVLHPAQRWYARRWPLS